MIWIPRVLVVALMLIGLGVSIGLHGKDKKGKHSGWATLIATAINLVLLWWGGFFDVVKP